jgi:NAD+ synthase (glutamine-hydrolysing)
MKLLRVASAALNQTPLAWEANFQNIQRAIELAREQQATVLCLPELCLTGYGCEDAFHSPGVLQSALELLSRIAPLTSGMVVSVGLPVMYGGVVFNAACLLINGRIGGFVAKQHLAGDGIHYEPRWFKPWPEGIHGVVEVDGESLPIGDIFFDVGGVKIGFEICEDAWVGSRPGASLAARGVDLILNPSASHFAFEKHAVRTRFVLEGSRAFSVTYVYSNLLGNEAGRAIYDGDVLIAAAGKLLASGPRLSFEPVVVTTTTTDIDATRMNRARTGSFAPEVDGDESDLVRIGFKWPGCQPVENLPSPAAWENSAELKFEEFARAVSLGLFDYLRKSRSQGFVVSLSGGVDSAAVSVLVGLACELGTAELGLPRFWEYSGVRGPAPENLSACTRRLLTTVYQRTRNSSVTTSTAARAVATAVHAEHHEVDVDALVEQYTAMIAGTLGRPLTWEQDDLALQNIQARVRAPGAWLLTNLKGALLLATSNRSEVAVGYATMDGDTAGGLSPLAGIDKAFLRRWLRWMESTGPVGAHPIPELGLVNQQQPTAELRPSGEYQTDEGDLMPYEVLDRIERLAIRDKLMPLEIFQHLRVEYPQRPSADLAGWITKFFRLFCRNQWKRERFAPAFHLDDLNLDPKTWCRFPILSGGFEYELEKLSLSLRQLENKPATSETTGSSRGGKRGS